MIDKRYLLLAAPFALFACGEKSAPTGQVVATVNGEEITIADLNAELNGVSAPTPEAQKNLQRAALDGIVNRTLIAQAAAEQGLDKGPEYAVLERKAKQAALVEMMQRKLMASAPKPAKDEVESFINNNAARFADRHMYVVDQLIVPQANQEVLRALGPVKSMGEAETVLRQRGLTANRTVGVIDSLTLPPAAAQQIGNLPAGEVFIVPSGPGLRINQIRSSQLVPLQGPQANAVAQDLLARERSQTTVESTFGKTIRDGKAKVKYNPAFAPPAQPTAKPAAGRTAAPAP